jgi:hypothetical protein
MKKYHLYKKPCDKCLIKPTCLKKGISACAGLRIWRKHYHHWNFLLRYGDIIFFEKRRPYTLNLIPFDVIILYDSIYDTFKRNDYPFINKNTLKIHNKYVLKLFKMFYVKNSKIKNINNENLEGIIQKLGIKK